MPMGRSHSPPAGAGADEPNRDETRVAVSWHRRASHDRIGGAGAAVIRRVNPIERQRDQGESEAVTGARITTAAASASRSSLLRLSRDASRPPTGAFASVGLAEARP